MRPKTLATVLSTAEDDAWLLPAAVSLATQFEAHLIGLCPSEIFLPASGFAEAGQVGIVAELMQRQQEEVARVGERFAEATRAQDFVAEFRAQETTMISAENFLLGNLRGADLIVAARPGPHAESSRWRLLEEVIRHSGRPVLVLPEGPPSGDLFAHLMIGWSDTREATRAAHDAITLAKPRAKVDILHAGRSGEEPGAAYRQDMAAAFDRHNFDVTVLEREPSDGSAGHALIQAATERGADVIAVGAFGHSRVYDFVVGAVTHYLLENAEVPVLFSK